MRQVLIIFSPLFLFAVSAYGQNVTVECISSFNPKQIFRGVGNEIKVEWYGMNRKCDSLCLKSIDTSTEVIPLSNCRFLVKSNTIDSVAYLVVSSAGKSDTFQLTVKQLPPPDLFYYPETFWHNIHNYIPDSVYAYALADRNKINFEVVDFYIEVLQENKTIVSLYNLGPNVSEVNQNKLREVIKSLKTGDKIVLKNAKLRNKDVMDVTASRIIVIH